MLASTIRTTSDEQDQTARPESCRGEVRLGNNDFPRRGALISARVLGALYQKLSTGKNIANPLASRDSEVGSGLLGEQLRLFPSSWLKRGVITFAHERKKARAALKALDAANGDGSKVLDAGSAAELRSGRAPDTHYDVVVILRKVNKRKTKKTRPIATYTPIAILIPTWVKSFSAVRIARIAAAT
jgi:hypothetical protein